MEQPTLHLLVSRLYDQLPRYVPWRPDPRSIAADAFLHLWDREYDIAFSLFSLISRVLRKIFEEKIDHLMIVKVSRQTQIWYAQVRKMSVQLQCLLPQVKNLLSNPQGKNHPRVETRSLRLVVLKVSGKGCKCK